jgi:hypothetical protein
MMKRLYIGELTFDNDRGNVAIVANNAKDAKRYAYSEFLDESPEWTEVRVKWKRDYDASNKPIGVLNDTIELIKEGIFAYAWNVNCPICGSDKHTIEEFRGTVACSNCLEKKYPGEY